MWRTASTSAVIAGDLRWRAGERDRASGRRGEAASGWMRLRYWGFARRGAARGLEAGRMRMRSRAQRASRDCTAAAGHDRTTGVAEGAPGGGGAPARVERLRPALLLDRGDDAREQHEGELLKPDLDHAPRLPGDDGLVRRVVAEARGQARQQRRADARGGVEALEDHLAELRGAEPRKKARRTGVSGAFISAAAASTAEASDQAADFHWAIVNSVSPHAAPGAPA